MTSGAIFVENRARGIVDAGFGLRGTDHNGHEEQGPAHWHYYFTFVATSKELEGSVRLMQADLKTFLQKQTQFPVS